MTGRLGGLKTFWFAAVFLSLDVAVVWCEKIMTIKAFTFFFSVEPSAIPSHANGYFTEVIIQENTWKKEEKKIEEKTRKKVAAYIFKPQIYSIFNPQILLHFKADADTGRYVFVPVCDVYIFY